MHHKFDIDDTAGAPLEIVAVAMMLRHAGAHLEHLLAERASVPGLAQNVATNRLEALCERRIARHRARPDQCLVLPDPGLRSLVLAECFQVGNHGSRAA